MTSSLLERFDARRNSLNALRLLLAALVIVSHSWPLSGHNPEPEWGGANLGTWAVFGFFAISGFLITRSRLSGRSTYDFYRARVLRIFPGFLVALLVVALGFAPLSQVFDPAASWHPLSSVTFVLRNLLLYPPLLGQPGIVHTLSGTPFPGLWDGSLWTLFWEACCYVAIGLAVSFVARKRVPILVIGLFVLLTLVSLAGAFGLVALPELVGRVIPMLIAFAAGSLLFLFGDRFRANLLTAGIALIVLVVVGLLGLVPQLGTLPLAYLLLTLGNVLPFHGVGRSFDISYGVYIYAWPVQQTLALAFHPQLPVPLFILLSFVGTIPLAFLSCWLIERPALALKRRPARSVPAPAPST
jgi:peptidoglycan/LPS O-acetylase OafA/YrhL